MGIGGAITTGSAASATNDAMLEWQRLFLGQDQLKSQNEQFDKQLKAQNTQFQTELRTKKQESALDRKHALDVQANAATAAMSLENLRAENDTELERMRQDHSMDIFDQETLRGIADRTLQLSVEGAYSPGETADLADELSERGGVLAAYASPLRASARDSIIENPQDALDTLQTVEEALRNPEAAAALPNKAVFDASVDSVIDLQGLTGDKEKEYRAQQDLVWEAASGNAEEVGGINFDILRNVRDDGRATIAGKTAQTELTETTNAAERYKLNNVLPSQARLLDIEVERAGLELDMRNVEATYQPQRLASEVYALQQQNKLGDATFQSVVDSAVATARQQEHNADLTEVEVDQARSQLSVMVATELTQIALAEGNLEGVKFGNQQTLQAIQESKARVEGYAVDNEAKRVQMEGLRQDIRLTALTTLTAAAEAGQLETVSQFGVDLLREAGIKDPEGVIQGWVDTTTENQTAAEQREALEMRLAVAETEQVEYANQTKEADRAHRVGMDVRTMNLHELQEEHDWWFKGETVKNWGEQNAIERDRIAATLAGQNKEGSGLTDKDVFEAVGLGATGGKEMADDIDALYQAVADAGLNINEVDSEVLEGLAGGKYRTVLSTLRGFMETKAAQAGIPIYENGKYTEAFKNFAPALMPATMGSPDDAMAYRLLTDLGLMARRDMNVAGPDGETVDPANATALGRYFVDIGEGDLAVLAKAGWESLENDQRAKFPDPLTGEPSEATYNAAISDGVVKAREQDKDYQESTSRGTQQAQQILGVEPAGEDGMLTMEQKNAAIVQADKTIDNYVNARKELESSDLTREDIIRVLTNNGLGDLAKQVGTLPDMVMMYQALELGRHRAEALRQDLIKSNNLER